ncbi:flagellar basal body-associated FliL family protein [Candidatus Clostridium radicumherbarum]|uniref:Flagellar protein FliL n=1 Tax=Candidatus Clostridium radicumherbarum TaxID=3381662 RepID=A0ABW8U0P4_9CLOT
MAEKKEKENVKEKGKSNGTLFKIILIVLLVLIVGSLSFVGYLLASKKTPVVINGTTTVATVNNSDASPYTYSLDEFLVNLSDDGGKKYLKIKLSLGYDAKTKKNMDKELADKTDNIRDTIISVLRSKKSTDIDTQMGIDSLKKEILAKVNPLFQSGKANSVYINDILVQ